MIISKSRAPQKHRISLIYLPLPERPLRQLIGEAEHEEEQHHEGVVDVEGGEAERVINNTISLGK